MGATPLKIKIVLHIDDDEDDRQIVKEAMEAYDVNVVVQNATSGTEGMEVLENAKASGQLPCMIILDINMPGKDGKQVLKEIKDDPILATIPLVLFTTSSSSLDKMFAERNGVEMITKPPTLENLLQTIQRFLRYC